MENKDFRDRLKNHTRVPNPAAWEQMENLLNTVPSPQEDKKKKRRGFWFFFFGLGILLLVSIAILTNGPLRIGQNKASLNNIGIMEKLDIEPVETSNEMTSNKPGIGCEVGKVNRDISQNNPNKTKSDPIKTQNDFNTISKPNQEVASAEKTSVESSQDEKLSFDIKKRPIGEVAISENENERNAIADNSNVAKMDSKAVANEIEKSNLNNSNNNVADSSEELLNSQETNKANQIGDVAIKENEIDSKTGLVDNRDTRVAQLPLSRLRLPMRKIERTEKEKLSAITEVIIHKPKNIEVYLGGGYALFNDNPGFLIHSGVSYSFDRILDLEANIGYAYGSEQNIPAGEDFTFEKQVDLNILFHLNFIKNHDHKFSFLAGIGYSFYSGERVIKSIPITINIRDNRGRNFQLGFDYKIRIKKYNSLGLRIGAISYDDAIIYSSMRFIQEF